MLPTKRISRPALIVFLALAFLTWCTHNLISPTSSFVLPYISSPDAKLLKYHGESDASTSTLGAPLRQRANATFVMLARNSEVNGAVQSVREIEDRFNRDYHYPWIFLNEEPFTDDFKRRVSLLTSGDVDFGLIPKEHWYQPSWIDETRATEERHKMEKENVVYGGSLPYRNMCRFNSGFFYHQPLLQKFRYYWRVEPGVHFHCDVNFDPFVYMHENNKKYGFTISLYEFQNTIDSLWSTVRDFITEHPEYVTPNNAMGFLSDNGGADYNLCHFWSNFEIADMDFFRDEAYTAFFEYLDSRGGFYYERWGDAPVHSIGVALLAGTDHIHFFREIGYEHSIFTHCPVEKDIWESGRCTCNPNYNFDYSGSSCLSRWDRMAS